MNVLHINKSDLLGGAAIASYRLHQGLLRKKIDSRLLVGTAKIKDEYTASIARNFKVEKGLGYFTRYLGLNYLNIVSSFQTVRHAFYQQADLINFHNLHNDYFNYLAVPVLTKAKPAILTLHDMWSLTGHCAYSYGCDRWKIGCGHCPDLDTYPKVNRDSTQLEWKLKNWVYGQANLTIVAPSRWLAELAKQSMLQQFRIEHIPYGIDTDVYQPLDPHQCRSLLGVPKEKYVLMFGAQDLTASRKGGDLLLKALSRLPIALKRQLLFLTLGDGAELISEAVGIQSLNLGYVFSDRLKSIAYSAADLFILPTHADNLPLVLQESMACGTPMVSFKVGGVPDLVRPDITGYLAKPGDMEDLCTGIVQLLEDKALRRCMGQNCRTVALQEYSLELQAQRYIELYQQVLQKNTSPVDSRLAWHT